MLLQQARCNIGEENEDGQQDLNQDMEPRPMLLSPSKDLPQKIQLNSNDSDNSMASFAKRMPATIVKNTTIQEKEEDD